MIVGYNTNIEHDGIVYHVQTEDNGYDKASFVSHVYNNGAIVASKHTSYTDLIENGFDSYILTERLHRQHKTICAAIHKGRIEDLKKLNTRKLYNSKKRSHSITMKMLLLLLLLKKHQLQLH
jgi:hypothetical protein